MNEIIVIPDKFKTTIAKITELALETKQDAYIVGGFIRDIVMGRDPKDLDIMIDSPDGGISFAKSMKSKFNITHEPVIFPRFGTALLIIDDNEVEFVMPRKEFYTDGSRKPDTELCSVETDVLRRDFSMNSLIFRLNDNKLFDYTKHGLQDIKDRIIRITDIGNEDIILSQDPLRMLRAIRFCTVLGFDIDNAIKDSIKKNSQKILTISMERIRDELNKILLSDTPGDGINMLRELELSQHIFPEIETLDMEQPKEHHHKDVYQHTLLVVNKVKPTLVTRWAALLHDIGKPVKRTVTNDVIHFYEHEKASADIAISVLNRFKFPTEFIDDVSFIVRNHMRLHSYTSHYWTDSAVRRLVIDMGKHLCDILDLFESDLTSSNPIKIETGLNAVRDIKARIKELETVVKSSSIRPLLNGHELQERFNLKPGAWIKQIHEKLLEEQLNNINLTKEEAFIIAKNMVEKIKIELKV